MASGDVSHPDKRGRAGAAGWGDDWSRMEHRELLRFARQREAVERWRATILELRARLQATRERNLRLMALRRRLTREARERDARPPGFLPPPCAGSDDGEAG